VSTGRQLPAVQSTAIAPKIHGNDRLAALKTQLEIRKESFAKLLHGSGITSDRFIAVLLNALFRDSSGKLKECDPTSLIKAALQAAELGLEVGSALGHAYITPRKLNNVQTAVFILGYRGMVHLMWETDNIECWAEVVHANDQFDYQLGSTPALNHRPVIYGERGPGIGVYACTRVPDGRVKFVYMSREEVEAIRVKSSSGTDYESGAPKGIWKENWEEMWKKTAIRRIHKTTPLTTVRGRQLMDSIENIEGENEGYLAPRQEQAALLANNPQGDDGDDFVQDAPSPPPAAKQQPPRQQAPPVVIATQGKIAPPSDADDFERVMNQETEKNMAGVGGQDRL